MTDVPKFVRERLKVAQAGPHPDADLLTAFAEQGLSEHERTPVLDHLARCAECREVVALALPPMQSAMLVSSRDTGRVQKAPWFRWNALRWGALAACVVVVGSAVLMQHSTTNRVSMTAAAVKESAGAVPLQQIAPQTGSTTPLTALNDQMVESEQDKSIATKGMLSQGQKEADEQFVFAKKLAVPAQDLKGRTTNMVEDKPPMLANPGLLAQSASAPQPLPAAPPPAMPQAEARSLPLEGRDEAGAARQSAPSTVTETVTVDAAAPIATTGQESLQKAEAGKAKIANSQLTAVGGLAAPVANEETAPREKSAKLHAGYFQFATELSRWTISSDGQLQHSVDSGKTWQPVTVVEKATFRALSANGPDVWVGGSAGLLYHSADAGGHWTQVKPTANGVLLVADIAAIEFTDPQHGKITTTTGEAWRTADAGQAWLKQP